MLHSMYLTMHHKVISTSFDKHNDAVYSFSQPIKRK